MFDEFMEMVKACGEDVLFAQVGEGNYNLTYNDFDGFDEHWRELEREYDNEEAVDALEDWMDEHCTSKVGDFYVDYIFPGFVVRVGYSSFNI